MGLYLMGLQSFSYCDMPIWLALELPYQRLHNGAFFFLLTYPISLANAPRTFMDLMNHIFEPYLDQFMVVFINNIIIYSIFDAQHENHLKFVLQFLWEKQLYRKLNKCEFLQSEVVFLGHVVLAKGIWVYPKKIEAITRCIALKCVKIL